MSENRYALNPCNKFVKTPFCIVSILQMSPTLYPIVCLNNATSRLYGELIQVMESRGTGWLRPLFLWLNSPNLESPEGLDLRGELGAIAAPDIICDYGLIHPVLDSDWITLLDSAEQWQKPESYAAANQSIRQFLSTIAPHQDSKICF